jgi:hypothetical protein
MAAPDFCQPSLNYRFSTGCWVHDNKGCLSKVSLIVICSQNSQANGIKIIAWVKITISFTISLCISGQNRENPLCCRDGDKVFGNKITPLSWGTKGESGEGRGDQKRVSAQVDQCPTARQKALRKEKASWIKAETTQGKRGADGACLCLG